MDSALPQVVLHIQLCRLHTVYTAAGREGGRGRREEGGRKGGREGGREGGRREGRREGREEGEGREGRRERGGGGLGAVMTFPYIHVP